MPKKLILVAGYLAGGKSTFAHALSANLGIPSYHKDNLNEIIGEKLTIAEGERPNLSDLAVDLLLYIADAALAAGNPLILESNFKPREAPAVRALAAKHGCDVLTFLFTGDLETIYDRFRRRDASPLRHPIHKSHGFHDLDKFTATVGSFADFAVDGERIVIDSTDFSQVDYPGLYAAAARFLTSRT